MDTDKLSGSSSLLPVKVGLADSKHICTLLIQLGACDVMIDWNKPVCSTDCLITSPGSSALTPSQLILSGGEGYINFRIGELRASAHSLGSVCQMLKFYQHFQATTRAKDRPIYPK